MFDLIKTNSGAIGLLVRFIWISVNAAIWTLMHTKQADRESETTKNMGLGPLPNELCRGSNEMWTQHGPNTSKRTKNRM